MSNKTLKQVIGIDVSKDNLEVFKNDFNKTKTYQNTSNSIKSFIKYIKKDSVDYLVVMESTGGYEKLACKLLSEADIKVHIAHPNKVHYFAKQKGFFAKTDSIDAKILKQYGEQDEITANKKYDKNDELKKELSSRRAQVVELITNEKFRLKSNLSSVIKKSINRTIKTLEKELKLIDGEISKFIEQNPEENNKYELLKTFKGVGKVVAGTLVCLMPELGNLSRAEIASLVGVAPKNNDSGTKRGKRKQ